MEGLGLDRLIILFVALFSISALAQDPIPASRSVTVENLPDAPRSQMASLFAETKQTIMRADILPPVSVNPASLEGTRVTLSMSLALSSKSPVGSFFQARLDQPLMKDGRTLLPQGTIFEGHVQTRPARRMMRPGTMNMTFDRMTLSDGGVQSVQLHLVNAETTGIETDPEGSLHPALSKKRLAIQLGGTAMTAKFADDLAEFAGGTAVGAGTARIIGTSAAATFFLLQKGREVKLNSGDKIEAEFGRAIAASSRDLP